MVNVGGTCKDSQLHFEDFLIVKGHEDMEICWTLLLGYLKSLGRNPQDKGLVYYQFTNQLRWSSLFTSLAGNVQWGTTMLHA